MFQAKINNIIYDIAQEEGLTYKEVKNIVNAYFLFTRIKMALGNPEKGRNTFKQLRLPGFGNFAIYNYPLNKFMKNNDKLDEKQTKTREKYNLWDKLNLKRTLNKEEKTVLDKLIKIEL
jgi:nucleoid DNA-binding protein